MFWAHLLTGVSAAAIILVMSVTGVLLTYQRQIQAWADTRGLDGSPSGPDAVQLTPDALLERIGATHGARPTGIRWKRDPHAVVEVLYGRESVLFVNGYTGAVLGDGSQRTGAFFSAVTDWHRWLALSGDGRRRGRAVTGAANLAFFFLVLAGFYLWWPRNLTARSLRNVVTFRRGLSSRARDFNLHNVIGIWSLVPLLVMIGSAVVISYGWAGALVTRITAEKLVVAAAAPAVDGRTADAAGAALRRRGGAQVPAPAHPARPPDAAALLDRARRQMVGWRSITMQLPLRGQTASFILDAGTGGQPQKQARLTLSTATGEVAAWEPFSREARPQRVRSILRYAHTGEVLGIAGQTIAGLVSAGVIMLVWTGISMALRRLRGSLARRTREPRRTPVGRSAGGPRDGV